MKWKGLLILFWIVIFGAFIAMVWSYMDKPVQATCCTSNDQLKKDIQKYYEKHPEERK